MKRMYKRLQFNSPAIVSVNPGTPGKRNYLLRIVNISAAGAMFHSEVHLPAGTPVQVFLHLEYDHAHKKKIIRVEFFGKVVRSEPRGFAVAFDEVHQNLMVQEGTTTYMIQ
jgi:hypothetical protein